MKRIPLYFLFYGLAYLNIISANAQNQDFPELKMINDELYYQKLSKQVYVITHYFPWGGNSLVVFTDNNQAILIDTPYDGVATDALLNWINTSFNNPEILGVIVTGFHQDNLGGNEVLFKKNIPVYGMSLTADLVTGQSSKLMEVILNSVKDNDNKTYFERYKQLNLLPPNATFDLNPGNEKLIHLGDEIFHFYFPGESHTIDNTVVYLPKHQLLFGGCMIRAMKDKRPGFLAYANVNAWPKSVEKVIQKYPAVKIVVPGHGESGNQELLSHTVDILNNWIEEHPK